jgi:hypothetical protein
MAQDSNIETMSTVELRNEIRRRERRLNSLLRKRDRLREQMAELDREIAEHGDEVGGGVIEPGRKRPRNEANLADALAELLSNQTMSVTQASVDVQKAGYKTTSPNFRTIVNQTLLKDPRFQRVSRGQYTADPSAKSGTSRTSKKRTKRRTKK